MVVPVTEAFSTPSMYNLKEVGVPVETDAAMEMVELGLKVVPFSGELIRQIKLALPGFIPITIALLSLKLLPAGFKAPMAK